MNKIKNILSANIIDKNTPVQEIKDPQIIKSGVRLFVKREDLNHSQLSGNKWHKLKYNLVEAAREKYETLLTFGGAYSNHIYATAAAGRLFGFKTIGIIRGEEHLPLNPTLSFARSRNMKLHYVSRSAYRNKTETGFINSLNEKFGKFYLIPEGGTNNLAVKGASEIVSDLDDSCDYYCCACGTGGTLAGIIIGLNGSAKALGFSVLKGGDFLIREINKLINSAGNPGKIGWDINPDYHFGGYAKINKQLIDFSNKFAAVNKIPIEPVYTGKMFFGLYDLISNGFFKSGESILAIHTGGMQGLDGMKKRIQKINNSASECNK